MLTTRHFLFFLTGLCCFTISLRAEPAQLQSEAPAAEPGLAFLLPTDQFLRQELDEPDDSDPLLPPPLEDSFSPVEPLPDPDTESLPDLKTLLRPRFDISAEWEPEADGVEMISSDLNLKLPLYPVFGPPPPFLTAGYSFTRINAPVQLDLPRDLHQFSLGVSWMRPLNERWLVRTMLSGVFATDFYNTGSMAWQFRGGMFAIYRPNEEWDLAFGALATGQEDIPVLPVIGATWRPSSSVKVNLMLPNPRISYLISESETRQQWAYVGGGMSGGNWAYNLRDGSPERLNYREWRLVVGWESMPPRTPGRLQSPGASYLIEAGYVFGRKFEREHQAADIKIDNTLLLHTGIRF